MMAMHVGIIRANLSAVIIVLYLLLRYSPLDPKYSFIIDVIYSINKNHTLANDRCFLVTIKLLMTINILLMHRVNSMVMVMKLKDTMTL